MFSIHKKIHNQNFYFEKKISYYGSFPIVSEINF